MLRLGLVLLLAALSLLLRRRRPQLLLLLLLVLLALETLLRLVSLRRQLVGVLVWRGREDVGRGREQQGRQAGRRRRSGRKQTQRRRGVVSAPKLGVCCQAFRRARPLLVRCAKCLRFHYSVARG